MWLFTKIGMFSVCAAHKKAGLVDKTPSKDLLRIRGRWIEHMVALKERFKVELAGCEIVTSTNADYRFYIVAPKTAVSKIVAEFAMEINYTKCKPVFQTGKGYHNAAMAVWQILYDCQVVQFGPGPYSAGFKSTRGFAPGDLAVHAGKRGNLRGTGKKGVAELVRNTRGPVVGAKDEFEDPYAYRVDQF